MQLKFWRLLVQDVAFGKMKLASREYYRPGPRHLGMGKGRYISKGFPVANRSRFSQTGPVSEIVDCGGAKVGVPKRATFLMLRNEFFDDGQDNSTDIRDIVEYIDCREVSRIAIVVARYRCQRRSLVNYITPFLKLGIVKE